MKSDSVSVVGPEVSCHSCGKIYQCANQTHVIPTIWDRLTIRNYHPKLIDHAWCRSLPLIRAFAQRLVGYFIRGDDGGSRPLRPSATPLFSKTGSELWNSASPLSDHCLTAAPSRLLPCWRSICIGNNEWPWSCFRRYSTCQGRGLRVLSSSSLTRV